MSAIGGFAQHGCKIDRTVESRSVAHLRRFQLTSLCAGAAGCWLRAASADKVPYLPSRTPVLPRRLTLNKFAQLTLKRHADLLTLCHGSPLISRRMMHSPRKSVYALALAKPPPWPPPSATRLWP
jgi:hypothetical protein